MEQNKPILEPKQSTINKIIAFSNSVDALQLKIFKDKVILNLN